MMELLDDDLNARDIAKKDYYYFLKLVPHVFIDKIKNDKFSSYSYSLNHNSKVNKSLYCEI